MKARVPILAGLILACVLVAIYFGLSASTAKMDASEQRSKAEDAAFEKRMIEQRNEFEKAEAARKESRRLEYAEETARVLAQREIEEGRRMEQEKLELMKERHAAENEIATQRGQTEIMRTAAGLE